MNRAKKEKFKRYFASTSLYMFVCLCVFSGLFFLLLDNPDFLDAMRDIVSHDTSLPWIWFILVPLYAFISIVAGAAFSFLYVEGDSSPRVCTKKTVAKKRTTTKKRK